MTLWGALALVTNLVSSLRSEQRLLRRRVVSSVSIRFTVDLAGHQLPMTECRKELAPTFELGVGQSPRLSDEGVSYS
jgi:hypothetical protein